MDRHEADASRRTSGVLADGVLSDLGEFGVLARIAALVQAPASPAGPGDDAAVVPIPGGPLVATTDLLVEGRHFRLDPGWSTPEQVGRKAAAANLADVAAMGARPIALLVGLAAPAGFPLVALDGLTTGLRDEAASTGAHVVGGDLVRSDTVLLAVTALGNLEHRPPVTRHGARPGDVVVVAGTLGWSAAGLALLEAGLERHGPEVVDRHRVPRPPYSLGPALAALGATSMIDISDGLAQDLGHVATASGVGIDLDLAAVRETGWYAPLVAAGQALGDVNQPDEWLLTGGEEHTLAVTVPVGTELPPGCTAIGKVIAGQGISVDGRPVAGGFDHFASVSP